MYVKSKTNSGSTGDMAYVLPKVGRVRLRSSPSLIQWEYKFPEKTGLESPLNH